MLIQWPVIHQVDRAINLLNNQQLRDRGLNISLSVSVTKDYCQLASVHFLLGPE